MSHFLTLSICSCGKNQDKSVDCIKHMRPHLYFSTSWFLYCSRIAQSGTMTTCLQTFALKTCIISNDLKYARLIIILQTLLYVILIFLELWLQFLVRHQFSVFFPPVVGFSQKTKVKKKIEKDKQSKHIDVQRQKWKA